MKKHVTALLILSLCLLCSCLSTGSGNGGKVTDGTEEAAGGISVSRVSPGEILDYFNEVAIGSEYGESAQIVCKWTKPISYRIVSGTPTEEDTELMQSLFDRLNTIEGFPGIRKAIGPEKADLELYFVPRKELENMFDAADESCAGMAEYSWDSSTGEIFSARVGIDEALTDDRRSTICEEILQSLGPACDSFSFINSVFYEGTSFVSGPSELDWVIMEILYSPEIPVGCAREDAISAAVTLLDWRK